MVETLFSDLQLKQLDDVVMQIILDKYAENHSQKTTRELVLKIRSSLKCAYARGLLTDDFGTLLKSKGLKKSKRNIVLSITEMKQLRQFCLENHHDEFNVLVVANCSAKKNRYLFLWH